MVGALAFVSVAEELHNIPGRLARFGEQKRVGTGHLEDRPEELQNRVGLGEVLAVRPILFPQERDCVNAETIHPPLHPPHQRVGDSCEHLRVPVVQVGLERVETMEVVGTVLGLLPMALGIGRGSDLRAPLAIAVIGGLIVATALTLIVVPVVYQTVETTRSRLAG